MAIARTRHFVRFEKADGSLTAVFPKNRYEYEQSQSLQLASMPLVGESYSFDNQGEEPSLKTNAIERVRFFDVNDAEQIDVDIDRFRSILTWGVGKIVTKGADGTERWAWGRPMEMPSVNINVEQINYQPVIIVFERSSDFYTDAHDELFNVGDPETIEVTNGGNADALDPIIILKGPFTNPSVTNNSAVLPGTSTPYKIESTRDATLGTEWLKFDARRNEVMWSTDSGANYADDSDNVVLQDGQLRMMVFKPGVNSLVVDNVTGDVEVEWTDTWH